MGNGNSNRPRFKRNVIGMLERMINGQPGMGPVLAGAYIHETLRDISRYSLLNEGSMWRPLILRAVASTYDIKREHVIHYSSIIEAIHGLTLSLDDLPCMDDAFERRGKSPAHIKFADEMGASKDSGTAKVILNVFGYLSHFDAYIIHGPATPEQNIMIFDEVTLAKINLASGQEIDLADTQKISDLKGFADFYRLKTGALYGAAMATAVRLGNEESHKVDLYREAGNNLGISFQFDDDILDWGGDQSKVKKTLGLDDRRNTPFDIANPKEIFRTGEMYAENARELLGKTGNNIINVKRLMSEMKRAFNSKMLPDKLAELISARPKAL